MFGLRGDEIHTGQDIVIWRKHSDRLGRQGRRPWHSDYVRGTDPRGRFNKKG